MPNPKRPTTRRSERNLAAALRRILKLANKARKGVAEGWACFRMLSDTLDTIADDAAEALALPTTEDPPS